MHTTKKVVAPGDYVVIFVQGGGTIGCVVQSGKTVKIEGSTFSHDDLIGRVYGSQISVSSKKKVFILRMTPDLISLSLPHRTQINYHSDISLVLILLDASPGKVIFEAGTGSGSLTSYLAMSVSPNGKVHTFEFHSNRCEEARKQLKAYGSFCSLVTCHHGNVISDGFEDILINDGDSPVLADGCYLDIASPSLALKNVSNILKPLGKFTNFSPCIEQVQAVCTVLNELGFQDIKTFELISTTWGVNGGVSNCEHTENFEFENALENKQLAECFVHNKSLVNRKWKEKSFCSVPSSFILPSRGHTGYLTVATKPLNDEFLQEF